MKRKKQKKKFIKPMRFEYGQFILSEERYTYKTFLRKYWWLHLTIVGLLLVAITLTIMSYSACFSDCQKLQEPDCWSTIISFTLAYLGAAFLGIIVFYNTCQRQYLEDRDANLKFNLLGACKNITPTSLYSEEELNRMIFKCWGGKGKPGSEKEQGNKGYLEFRIKNYNYRYPMYIDIVDAYYNDGNGNIVDVKNLDFKSTIEKDSPLDYKEEGRVYVGISQSIIGQFPKTIAYVFQVRNVKDVEEYCVYFAALYQSAYSCVIKRISIKEYEKSMKEKQHPLGMWEVYLKLGQNS